jgi:BTB/POZ domain-containing protein 13
MFSGQWKESDEPLIQLNIPDENVDVEALDLALSSLYKDEVELTPSRICPTLAAASLLQLDGLKEHCVQFMKDNLNVASVIYFLKTSTIYGVQDVKERCMEWLHLNTVWDSSPQLLGEMDQDLLVDLIQSPELFVMQVEMDVYTMAKKWLFLQMCPTWSGEDSKLLPSCDSFFQELGEKNKMEFLLTEGGRQYCPLFRSVRYRAIINDGASIRSVEEDRIVPNAWLLPFYKQQWLKMLDVEQGADPGPMTVTPDVFSKVCVRCGRILTEDVMYCWRWTGFSFGFDVLLTYSNGELLVKRNTHSQPCNLSVSLQAKRTIVFRIKVAYGSDEGDKDVRVKEDTGMMRMALSPDEEQSILKLDQSIVFPLYIGMNFCITGN